MLKDSVAVVALRNDLAMLHIETAGLAQQVEELKLTLDKLEEKMKIIVLQDSTLNGEKEIHFCGINKANQNGWLETPTGEIVKPNLSGEAKKKRGILAWLFDNK